MTNQGYNQFEETDRMLEPLREIRKVCHNYTIGNKNLNEEVRTALEAILDITKTTGHSLIHQTPKLNGEEK